MLSSYSLATTDKHDRAKGDPYVTRLLSMATRAEQDLLLCQTVLSKPKVRAKTGSFSSNLVSMRTAMTGSKAHVYQLLNAQDQPRDPLSRIPYELQCQIWSNLNTLADRTAFALTCKHHAAMFESEKAKEECSTKPKSPTRSGGTEKLNKIAKPRRRNATKTDKLMVLHRLQDWRGMHGRWLCYQCVRFLPSGYTFETQGWSGKVVHSRYSDIKKAIVEGRRCGACVQRARLQTSTDAAHVASLTEKIRLTVGLRH